jgi:hypothetical protein
MLTLAAVQAAAVPGPTRPALPLAPGAVTIVQRTDADGGYECAATSENPQLQSYGEATCARFRAVSRGPRRASPVREITMVIAIAPAGGTALPDAVGRGSLAVDQEAELTVAADGSLGTCRSLRNVVNAPATAQPPMCDRLRQDGPGAFSPGAAGRQARLRTSVFLWLALPRAG